jgi:hypothetical protein
MLAQAAHMLQTMGYRADAGETAAFVRQLEYVKARTYDVKYLELKARQFLPVDSEVPSGAESFTWRSWDWAGMAKILANYADDLPKVTVLGKENVQGIKSLGASYDYTIQDIRAASMAGTNLDARKAMAARRAVENRIEKLAAVGDSMADLPGFLNNANVPILTNPTINANWPAATSAQILDDLHEIANKIVEQTLDTHRPDTMLLPVSRYSIVATRSFSTTIPDTILSVFLRTSPWIRNVDQWSFLDTAGTGGITRAVAYERSPEVVELVIPQEFEQFPPQARNLSFEVPCHARIGGVSIRYPLAMVYADGV